MTKTANIDAALINAIRRLHLECMEHFMLYGHDLFEGMATIDRETQTWSACKLCADLPKVQGFMP